MIFWWVCDDLKWWSSQKQAKICKRKESERLNWNKVGAEELKDEMEGAFGMCFKDS